MYVAEGICFVPPVLSADYAARRSAARETLTEIIVADLGDEISKSPYLIVSNHHESMDSSGLIVLATTIKRRSHNL